MNFIKLLLLVILTLESTIAVDLKPCTEHEWGGSQADMNICASKDLEIVDMKLNKTYKEVQEKYKNNKEFLKNLKNSQRAWIVLRDTNLKLIYPEGEFLGSAQPMCQSTEVKQFTLKRIQFLKGWLSISEKEETDICLGSRRI